MCWGVEQGPVQACHVINQFKTRLYGSCFLHGLHSYISYTHSIRQRAGEQSGVGLSLLQSDAPRQNQLNTSPPKKISSNLMLIELLQYFKPCYRNKCTVLGFTSANTIGRSHQCSCSAASCCYLSLALIRTAASYRYLTLDLIRIADSCCYLSLALIRTVAICR